MYASLRLNLRNCYPLLSNMVLIAISLTQYSLEDPSRSLRCILRHAQKVG